MISIPAELRPVLHPDLYLDGMVRLVEFDKALPVGTRLALFSADKPNRFFWVIKFWIDETLEIALALRTGGPFNQVEEGKMHLLLHLPIEEKNEDRRYLWRPDQAGFDSRSIFDGALVEQ